jgi:hypothetical protein
MEFTKYTSQTQPACLGIWFPGPQRRRQRALTTVVLPVRRFVEEATPSERQLFSRLSSSAMRALSGAIAASTSSAV